MEILKYNSEVYRPTSFNQFIDQFFNDEFSGGRMAKKFTPKVDIAETDQSFEIQLQLPGMPKDQIDIAIEKNQIIVSGERKIEKNDAGKKFNSIESHFGAFSRAFTLPEAINRDKIEAHHTHGILTIQIPKDVKKMVKKKIAIS
jgi:HSP20 family protein